jgi:basic amino acid/polyamine antiporter, APA family
MASLDQETWYRLVIWLVIGLSIYFGYSRHHSHLAQDSRGRPENR